MGSSTSKSDPSAPAPASQPVHAFAKTAPQSPQKAVNIAVKFLKGPEMKKIDKETKISFLQRKGLTKELIKKAFQIAEAEEKQ